MTVLVYVLATIALLVAVGAALGLHRELRDDLVFAGRRFRGLRIVIRRGGRVARPCEGQAHNLSAIHGTRVRSTASAPPRSTNGHRLPTTEYQPSTPTITFTTKGGRHA